MRRALALAIVCACNSKKPPAPTIDSGAPLVIAGTDAAGPEASNELDVRRYEDETPVDHLPLTVKGSAATVQKWYPKGPVIATLNKGEAVVQLAERYGFYRVTFTDPKDPARKMMGWVAKFPFDEPVDAGLPAKIALPKCAVGTGDPGTPLVVLEGQKARCAYVCRENHECLTTTGGNCVAVVIVPSSGEIHSNPDYTTVCTGVVQAPKPTNDGGKSVPSLFGTVHLSNGKCPPGFASAPKVGDLCYRSCTADKDCPEGALCKNVQSTKLCSTN
jgi:hypothetical protein